MLIDTHCHLDAAEFSADRSTVFKAAQAVGVAACVVPAVAAGAFANVRACCHAYRGVYPAYGLHPLYVDQVPENGLERLRRWLAAEMAGDHPPVALGEIGLDRYAPGVDAVRQEFFFVEQLKIAREFDLPVLLHSRRAVDAVLHGLRRIGSRGGVAHAFNGSLPQAAEFIRRGFKLGFGGTISYPGATRIRRLAADLPLEAIVLETDAPDIPPAWLAGARNSPAELAGIAQVLAELRVLDGNEIARATTGNARAVLGLAAPCRPGL